MKKLRIYSPDNKENLTIAQMMSPHYDVQWVNKNPDIVFLGSNDNNVYTYNCIRVLCASEHFFPKNIFCDIIISHRSHHDIMQHSLMPFSFGLWEFLDGKNPHFISKNPTKNRHFCMFMYGNKYAGFRNRFYKKMQQRFNNDVHSWGRWQKNIESLATDKGTITAKMPSPKIMEHYRFVLCFENANFYDNFTEKVGDALRAGAIPIYWGGDSIYKYIKKDAFINVKDFKNISDCLNYIAKVDNTPELYQSYIHENPFLNNDFIRSHQPKCVGKQLKQILDTKQFKRTKWDTGFIGKAVFKILFFLYRKLHRCIMLKRYFYRGYTR